MNERIVHANFADKKNASRALITRINAIHERRRLPISALRGVLRAFLRLPGTKTSTSRSRGTPVPYFHRFVNNIKSDGKTTSFNLAFKIVLH